MSAGPLLRDFGDCAEHLTAASLSAAPDSGVLTFVDDDARGIFAHARDGLIGECENRRVARPLHVNRDRHGYFLAAVLNPCAESPKIVADFGDLFDGVFILGEGVSILAREPAGESYAGHGFLKLFFERVQRRLIFLGEPGAENQEQRGQWEPMSRNHLSSLSEVA